MSNNSTPIDVTLDFLDDTPDGKDPDKVNATLRQYHKLLAVVVIEFHAILKYIMFTNESQIPSQAC
jgi:hypothetical protein